jgi:hypothetical protein
MILATARPRRVPNDTIIAVEWLLGRVTPQVESTVGGPLVTFGVVVVEAAAVEGIATRTVVNGSI